MAGHGRRVSVLGVPTSAGSHNPGQEKAPAAWRAAGLTEVAVEVLGPINAEMKRLMADPVEIDRVLAEQFLCVANRVIGQRRAQLQHRIRICAAQSEVQRGTARQGIDAEREEAQ